MKKKILSVFLIIAMALAIVPTFGVMATATESGTTYTVTDAASITALIEDTTKNVSGNTMKLTQDITYEASTASLWDGFLMNIDGNGHTITLKNGTYNSAILFYPQSGTAGTPISHTVKNLAVVMYDDDAMATSSEFISLFGENLNYATLTVENCYFDLNFKVTGTGSNNGTAVLLSRHRTNNGALTINAKNSYFKMDTLSGTTDMESAAYGQHGALVGRRWNNTTTAPVITCNVENCGFDVNYGSNISKGGAIIGEHRRSTVTVINTTGTNIIYNNVNATNYGDLTAYNGYDIGFTKNVTNVGIDTALTLTEGWTYTTTGSPMPAAVVKNFSKLFKNTVEDAVTDLEGYQTSVIYENTKGKDVFDLRLVATVEAADEVISTYKNVGFKVVANYGDTNVSKALDAPRTTIYNSILARDGVREDKTYTASDLLGEGVNGYIFVLPIKNIDAAAGIITFDVTTYYTNADDEVVNGSTYTFTVNTADIPASSVGN